MRLLLAFGACAALSCSGGGQGQGPGGPGGPGDNHVGDDLDTGDQPPADAGADTPPGAVDGGAAVTPPTPGTVLTAELKNSGTTDLELNVDKGWGIALNGYSGVPPKAKAILIFPT